MVVTGKAGDRRCRDGRLVSRNVHAADLVFLWLALGPLCATSAAQVPETQGQAAVSATPAEGPSLTIGWEVRRDRYHYRFENPSSFDTSYAVPHFYRQDYDADNAWLTVTGRYRVFGRFWETSVSVAPWGVGQGGDYDTFYQQDGDVVVYGTTAVTDLRAFQLAQRADLGLALGLRWRGGYVFRRDRAGFRPSDTTTTHTVPASTDRFFNTDRETTWSDVHEVQVGAHRTRVSGRWETTIGMDVTPIALGKLTTRLPDKYPDHDIVATARGFGVAPAVRVSITRGRIRAGVALDYVHTWPYSRVAQVSRDGLSMTVFAGLGPEPGSGLR
jgi:hypothetical protein